MGLNKKEYYLYKSYTLKDGFLVKVINYKTCKEVTIKFEYGYEINTTISRLNKGIFKHPLQKTVYGVGYIGFGKYNPSHNKILYDAWRGMIRRCYDYKDKLKNLTYKGVTVCEEWHNFQNFAAWYNENRKEYMVGWHIDKDIILKGNKVYSPETCDFVPAEVNSIIRKKRNGSFLPIGVSYNKRDKLYCIPVRHKGKINFHTIEEAFEKYRTVKQQEIKRIANKWKGLISDRIYNALINYTIEM